MDRSEPVDVVIRGAMVVTMDSKRTIIPEGALAVRGDKIAGVGAAGEFADLEAAQVIDAKGSVLLPGLVNAHTHAAMTLFRGLADDLALEPWLQRIWPMEMKFAIPENIRLGSELAFAEMIRSGTTTAADMYWHCNETTEVAQKVGMRLVNGVGVIDTLGQEKPLEKERLVRDFVERYRDDALVHPCIQVHSIYTVAAESFAIANRLSQEYGLPFITHASESRHEVAEVSERFGMTPIRYLDHLGMLRRGSMLAHCVHLSDEEIELLAKSGAAVAHCPESNLKIGAGIARLPAMLEAGVILGLGTDGVASNNDLDLWGEMHTAALLHKGVAHDPTVVKAYQVLEMATMGGACALGLDGRIGSLEAGKQADLILVDLDDLHLTPLYDLVSHLVYAAHGADVSSVMINGRFVMRERQLLTINTEDLKENMRQVARQISRALAEL